LARASALLLMQDVTYNDRGERSTGCDGVGGAYIATPQV
jgi:hypothetical protein